MIHEHGIPKGNSSGDSQSNVWWLVLPMSSRTGDGFPTAPAERLTKRNDNNMDIVLFQSMFVLMNARCTAETRAVRKYFLNRHRRSIHGLGQRSAAPFLPRVMNFSTKGSWQEPFLKAFTNWDFEKMRGDE
jgi:hypothetical protein